MLAHALTSEFEFFQVCARFQGIAQGDCPRVSDVVAFTTTMWDVVNLEL